MEINQTIKYVDLDNLVQTGIVIKVDEKSYSVQNKSTKEIVIVGKQSYNHQMPQQERYIMQPPHADNSPFTPLRHPHNHSYIPGMGYPTQSSAPRYVPVMDPYGNNMDLGSNRNSERSSFGPPHPSNMSFDLEMEIEKIVLKLLTTDFMNNSVKDLIVQRIEQLYDYVTLINTHIVYVIVPIKELDNEKYIISASINGVTTTGEIKCTLHAVLSTDPNKKTDTEKAGIEDETIILKPDEIYTSKEEAFTKLYYQQH